MQMVIAWE
jgi:G patch domain-containing protein 1